MHTSISNVNNIVSHRVYFSDHPYTLFDVFIQYIVSFTNPEYELCLFCMGEGLRDSRGVFLKAFPVPRAFTKCSTQGTNTRAQRGDREHTLGLDMRRGG